MNQPHDAGTYRIENQQPVQGQVIGNYNTVNIYGLSSSSQEEREQRLRLLLSDHSGFLRDRLASFVGRQHELETLRHLIRERLQTGGYVTITGPAGQGKSSIIAKLVHDADPKQVAYHFVPINPGPDHQVVLLRNLMAHLILKYQLTELFVASESRAVLRDFFPKVLAEVADKGEREVIYIDGLDQVEEDIAGVRDLSFLPVSPPTGIVFVLGTRPNDTLKPLELLKPRDEYRLPNLSRADFDLLLRYRGVFLEPVVANRLYREAEENALYLDLIVHELREIAMGNRAALIIQLADNPDQIFSIALERLKRLGILWQQVIYPVLGVLLVAREPLGLRLIRHILNVEEDRLRDGLQRLGGLVISDGRERYSLFHRKFYDYLRQDESRPEKGHLFATDEERGWHARLARWCEQDDLAKIWQDWPSQPAEHQRRLYAREHCLIHLYLAREWDHLFEILNAGSYGQYKIRVADPGAHSYALDLDGGRQAAAWEGWEFQQGIAYLPYLWRYTLLRCSLRSRADQYPLDTFRLLLKLGREKEVIGLADLLTNLSLKVSVLLELGRYFLAVPEREMEGKQCFLYAWEVAHSITEGYQKCTALRELAEAMTHSNQEQGAVVWQEAIMVACSIGTHSLIENAQQAEVLRKLAMALTQAHHEEQAEIIWQKADKVARSIHFGEENAFVENFLTARALQELAGALAQVQRWEQAEMVACSIGNRYQQAYALATLAKELFKAQYEEQAEERWQEAEAMVHLIEESRHRAEVLRVLAEGLTQAQRWEQAEAMMHLLEDEYQQAWALRGFATALTQARHEEQAETIWHAAEEVARSIKQPNQRAETLRDLTEALGRAQRWEQAETVAYSIEDRYQQAWAFSRLAFSLLAHNQRDQAQRLCDRIEGVLTAISWDQAGVKVLREFAETLTQVQYEEQAEIAWQEAERAVRSIRDRNQQAQALREMAEALARAQRWEQAEAVAYSIEQTDQKSWALHVLAGALTQAQRWEQAEVVARSIEQATQKSGALRMLAEALTQAQRREDANVLWQEVEKIVYSFEQPEEKVGMLRELASTLTKAQRQERAEVVWQEAEKVTHSLPEDNQRASSLLLLVEALIDVQYWEQAERVAYSIEQNYHRTGALRIVAEALALARCEKQAEAIWQEAQRVAHSIEDPFQKAEALSELAAAATRVQRKEQAVAVWEEAEEITHSIASPLQRFGALRTLAVALTTAKREKQAEAIWREASAMIQSLEDIWRTIALSELVMSLIQARRWEQAEEIAHSIEPISLKAVAVSQLAEALAQAQQLDQFTRIARFFAPNSQPVEGWRLVVSTFLQQDNHEEALHIIQRLWLQAESREAALNVLPLALNLTTHQPNILSALYSATVWVHTSLHTV